MRKTVAPFLVFLAACSSESPDASEPTLDVPAADIDTSDVAADVTVDTVEDPAADLIEEVADVVPDSVDDGGGDVIPDTDAVADAPDADVGPVEPEAGRPPRGTPVEVFVGAHPDDDLLFMNPDILDALRARHAVRTFMLTAGDACGTRDPALRELGLRAAYGLMTLGAAADESDWTCLDYDLGMPAHICWLDSPTPVSLVFLRAPDCAPALLNLLEGEVESLPSVATPSTDIFADDISLALAHDLAEIDVVRVHTLEPTGVYGHDNDDHIASARIALEAAAAAGVTDYREHRTYNTDEDPLNVHPDDLEAKWEALIAYCGPAEEEEGLCVRESGVAFWEWSRRQYTIQRLEVFEGRLQSGGACLSATAEGAAMGPCGGADSWVIDGLELRNDVGCLTVEGGSLVAGDCATPAHLMSNGQLRIGDHRACVTASDTPTAELCAADESGGPIARQRWSLGVGAVTPSELFSDTTLSGSGQRSFQLGAPVDDATTVCVRATEGLSCSTQTPEGWTDPSVLNAEFSNVAGWSSLARDATVTLADINADGLLDLCGRGFLGMLCALGEDAGYGPVALLSNDPYFGDDTGEFWFEFSYFQTLGWPFLGHDSGRPHLCVRSPVGISCSEPSPDGGWGALRDVLQTEFNDELGWSDDMYGATIRYGDIDGDGIDDVCGRGAPGLVCALGTAEGSFTNARFWGFREELADAAGWTQFEAYTGALSLVDLNGDGRADACLRSPQGVMCGWSTGTTFDQFFLVGEFTDDEGYEAEPHGTSVRWDTVGRNVCARHPEGVHCAPY